jgi:hypothetical protein
VKRRTLRKRYGRSVGQPSSDYMQLVRAVLRHSHGMTFPSNERAYVARCERAEISPRHVADIIAIAAKHRRVTS